MSAPSSRLFLASAPPATAPPTPPITVPWVFLSPGRLSHPARGQRMSDAIKRVIICLCLSMSGSLCVKSGTAFRLSEANAVPSVLPISTDMPLRLAVWNKVQNNPPATARAGEVELVADEAHFEKVVLQGMLAAKVSLDIATADFKAMLVPRPGRKRAPSIVELFRKLAEDGVEIRLMHS